MVCKKCGKDTCVLVTEQNKKKVRERRGLVWTILGAPFWLIGKLWRALFGRKEKYHQTQHWHCNYCGKNFKDKNDEE